MKPTVADSRTPNRLILRGPAGDLPPVTAEAAGSSPVVPAISNQALTEMASSRRRHKKAPNRHKAISAETSAVDASDPYSGLSVARASSLAGLASLLIIPYEKGHHGGLRGALLTSNGLCVGVQSDADR
jgi:hypothetical protein